MNLRSQYNEIIEKLKKGERPVVSLDEETFESLKTRLMTEKDEEVIKEALCLLEFSRKIYPKLLASFLRVLNDFPNNSFLLIAVLGAGQKHLTGYFLKEGLSIPKAYLDSLERLLFHKDPEVVEWVVRGLEEMGPQAKQLNQSLEKIKPSRLKIFNVHNRNIREIIHLMQSRW